MIEKVDKTNQGGAMMNKYRVKVEFKDNEERRGSSLPLVQEIELNLHHTQKDGKIFTLEFFRELAYSEIGEELMLKCPVTGGDGLAFFDYDTLKEAFRFEDAKSLARYFYQTYEIKSVGYITD